MFQNANVLITGGNFVAQANGQSSKALDGLMEATSLGALYNSGDRFDPPKCHPNTRTAILQQLMDWCIGEFEKDMFILWLYGPAGAGKSAIAQTFAEKCAEADGLLASFFFSRSDPRRSSAIALAATISYQIMLRIPESRPFIEAAIKYDLGVFQLNFETQFNTLIIYPLLQLAETGRFTSDKHFPSLIIIDGLDECAGEELQGSILHMISVEMMKHRSILPFEFLITSRPEFHITSEFENIPELAKLTYRLPLEATAQAYEDIRTYLTTSFEELRAQHLLKDRFPTRWPTNMEMADLTQRSSGHFIYADTVVRYVSSPRHNPIDRLRAILGLRPAHKDRPFAQLDTLYRSILSSVNEIQAAIKILGIALVRNDISKIEKLEEFMLLEPGTAALSLIDLRSVVDASDSEKPIKYLHASFRDYLLDADRSGDFFIDMNVMSIEAIRLYMRHVNLFWNADCDGETIVETQAAVDFLREGLGHMNSRLFPEVKDLHEHPSLREDVLAAPYVQFLRCMTRSRDNLSKESQRRLQGSIMTERLNSFFRFVRNPSFHNSQELYIHHRKVWDHWMLDEMFSARDHGGLSFWTAIYPRIKEISKNHNRYGFLDDTGIDIMTMLALPSSPVAEDQPLYVPMLLFSLDNITVHVNGTKYIELDNGYFDIVLDFLNDPTRAGPYALTSATYTAAALFAIEFATRPWDDRKIKIASWGTVWNALIFILSKAEHSTELLDMFNRPGLTFYIGLPDNHLLQSGPIRSYQEGNTRLGRSSKGLLGAIDDYFVRCTGSSPKGFEIAIQWTPFNELSLGKIKDDCPWINIAEPIYLNERFLRDIEEAKRIHLVHGSPIFIGLSNSDPASQEGSSRTELDCENRSVKTSEKVAIHGIPTYSDKIGVWIGTWIGIWALLIVVVLRKGEWWVTQGLRIVGSGALAWVWAGIWSLLWGRISRDGVRV